MLSKIRNGIFAALGMLVLILDTKTALQGGLSGVHACMMAVIPSLLPFFVVSIMLTNSLSGLRLGFLAPLGRLCRMPAGSEQLLILGLLGGYPTGAQAVGQSYRNGDISRQDANRLLGFCSNAGPSFLFGIAAAAFARPWMPWALWLIHILSAVLTGMLLPGKAVRCARTRSTTAVSLPDAIEQAAKIMAKVCAWIILFRVILAFCDRWFLWLFNAEAQTLFVGLLELANGCLQLHRISNTGLRFVVCSCILSLGGLSVAMQTLSVTGSLGFGMYLHGKFIQTLISFLLAYPVQFLLCGEEQCLISPVILIVAVAILGVFLLFLHKNKNYSRNPEKVIV